MRSVRLAALLLLTLGGVASHAQGVAPECAKAEDVEAGRLVGLWRAEVQGQPAATLLLEPHRQHLGSLSGEINRDGARSRIAADLDDGEFTLEESADGVHIAATWLGDVVEGSCGKEIKGQWQAEGGQPRSFVLRRVGR